MIVLLCRLGWERPWQWAGAVMVGTLILFGLLLANYRLSARAAKPAMNGSAAQVA